MGGLLALIVLALAGLGVLDIKRIDPYWLLLLLAAAYLLGGWTLPHPAEWFRRKAGP